MCLPQLPVSSSSSTAGACSQRHFRRTLDAATCDLQLLVTDRQTCTGGVDPWHMWHIHPTKLCLWLYLKCFMVKRGKLLLSCPWPADVHGWAGQVAMRDVLAEQRTGDEDALCAICAEGHSMEPDQIVFCERCDLGVHQRCYGVEPLPAGVRDSHAFNPL